MRTGAGRAVGFLGHRGASRPMATSGRRRAARTGAAYGRVPGPFGRARGAAPVIGPAWLARRRATPVARPAQSDVDAFGRSERFRAVARRVFGPVYRWWFRVEWEGLEHVPASGGRAARGQPRRRPAARRRRHPPRHRGGARAARVRPGRPPLRGLPLVGTVWSRVGGVVGHPDNAEPLLREHGALVLVFPEGAKGPAKTYRHRYQLRRFGRGGFVEIAMRAGVPIIPIAVVGAEEAMPIVFPDGARLLGTALPPADREPAGVRAARRRDVVPRQAQAAGPAAGHLRRATRPAPLLPEPGDGRGRRHPPRPPGRPLRHAPHPTQHLAWLMGRRVLITGLSTSGAGGWPRRWRPTRPST